MSDAILEPVICASCRFWAGICLKGKINRLANSEKCEMFEPRRKLKEGMR